MPDTKLKYSIKDVFDNPEFRDFLTRKLYKYYPEVFVRILKAYVVWKEGRTSDKE